MEDALACCNSVAQYIAWITLVCNLITKPCHAVTPAHLPMVYLAENCDKVDLQGVRRMVIATQREDLYANNVDCTLLLSVRGGYVMRFSFEHLDLPEPMGGICEDSVQLYNGFTKELTLTRPICGMKTPEPFVSNSSQVALRFRTNFRKQQSGFRLQAERIKQTEAERMGCSREQTAGCSIQQTGLGEAPPGGNCVHSVSLYSWPVAIVGLIVAWILIMYSVIRR